MTVKSAQTYHAIVVPYPPKTMPCNDIVNCNVIVIVRGFSNINYQSPSL